MIEGSVPRLFDQRKDTPWLFLVNTHPGDRLSNIFLSLAPSRNDTKLKTLLPTTKQNNTQFSIPGFPININIPISSV